MFGAIDRIRKLATSYSKPELSNLARTGQIPPQDAVLAGMMIDRIAKSAMQPPQTTVAEDVLGAQPGGTGTMAGTTLGTGGQQLGPTAPPAAPPPAMAAHGGLMGMLPHSDGVASLPSNIHHMAGGGIVAFAEGGAPEPTYLPNNIDFEKGAIPVYQAKAPEQISLSQAAESRRESEKQAGLDPMLYENLRKDVLADKEDFAKQKDEAKGMAILRAGLGLMGARKGQEFQTLSTSAQQALSEYGSALKDIKTSEKEMKKSLRDLSLAEAAYKKSNADKDLARVESAKDKLQAHEENYAKAQNDAVTKKVDVFKAQKQAETQLETARIGKSATLGAAQIHADSAERIAKLPGDQQKMLLAIHEGEVKKNPDNPPSLAETYERMHTTQGKAEARAKYALALEKEWNDLGVMQGKYMKDNPTIKSGDDYIKHKMAIFDAYYGKPGAGAGAGGGGGAATNALPMPTTQSDLVKGSVYNTARGPATWNGTAFVPVQ